MLLIVFEQFCVLNQAKQSSGSMKYEIMTPQTQQEE
jgi:hypothetical protein